MKLLVLTHNLSISVTDEFAQALSYHKEQGIDWSIEYKEVPFRNAEIQQYVSTITGYDAICYVYERLLENDGLPRCMALNKNTCFIHMPVGQIEKAQKDGWIWSTIAHELTHVYGHLLFVKYGIRNTINEAMDTYDQNLNPYALNGNFARSYALLKPYLSLFTTTMPQVTLTRLSGWNGKETVGHLTTNGFECRTLELPWLDNKNNISCIAPGIYPVKWTYSLKFPLGTYEVQNVAGRSGIRIHSGNYAFGLIKDTEGCILVGDSYLDLNKDSIPEIINSQDTLKKLNAFFNKKPFTLVVK